MAKMSGVGESSQIFIPIVTSKKQMRVFLLYSAADGAYDTASKGQEAPEKNAIIYAQGYGTVAFSLNGFPSYGQTTRWKDAKPVELVR